MKGKAIIPLVLMTSEEPFDNVTARVADVMSPTGLTTYSITMTHATEANPVEKVVISIPYADVSLMGSFFGSTNSDIAGSCSMRKEGVGG